MAEDLVTVATFRHLADAEIARLFLEEEGIHVAAAQNTDAVLGDVLGKVDLQVPDSEAERATQLLRKLEQEGKRREELDEDLDEDEDEDVPLNCLSCGKPMPDNAEKCPACGWSYGTAVET